MPKRPKEHLSGKSPQCRRIHRAIQKYGQDAFSVEIIRYPGISHEALNAIKRWKIRQLQTLSPGGCNLTGGGEGGKRSEKTCQKISESVSKQVAEGTHHLLDGEIQRRRVEDGTHNLLGKNNPVHKRVADGTHHFLGGEVARRNVHKRVADGTHNFLGENNPNQKRIEDGTHNFLDGEVARHRNQKRIEDGTHHFLGENNPMKRLSKDGRHPRTLKRLKGEWCYIIALSRFWYEIHDYTLKRRAEFLSKDIPDTSNAKQEYLF